MEKREESWSLKAASVTRCECSRTAVILLSSLVPSDWNLLWKSAPQIHGKMYERHKRRYSFCSKGERAVDVVLIKVGYSALPQSFLCR